MPTFAPAVKKPKGISLASGASLFAQPKMAPGVGPKSISNRVGGTGQTVTAPNPYYVAPPAGSAPASPMGGSLNSIYAPGPLPGQTPPPIGGGNSGGGLPPLPPPAAPPPPGPNLGGELHTLDTLAAQLAAMGTDAYGGNPLYNRMAQEIQIAAQGQADQAAQSYLANRGGFSAGIGNLVGGTLKAQAAAGAAGEAARVKMAGSEFDRSNNAGQANIVGQQVGIKEGSYGDQLSQYDRDQRQKEIEYQRLLDQYKLDQDNKGRSEAEKIAREQADRQAAEYAKRAGYEQELAKLNRDRASFAATRKNLWYSIDEMHNWEAQLDTYDRQIAQLMAKLGLGGG